jgi:hypothetical protein
MARERHYDAAPAFVCAPLRAGIFCLRQSGIFLSLFFIFALVERKNKEQ